MNPWKSSSAARRREVVQVVSDMCRQWFDSDGNWVNPVQVGEDGEWINPPRKLPATFTRMVFWLCMSLMDGDADEVKLGNAILAKTRFLSHHSSNHGGAGAPFDIFATNHSMQMLALHGDKLGPAVRAKIESWARGGLADYHGNRQADYQFHGFNDNMPAKATLGLVLGGEYFEDEAALAHGIWNLKQLRDLLTRRGLISEYNSPTYTPFTIVNLTEVALHARNAEARSLAEQCVERLWADILGHFHAPTGISGGPYSRAYHFDSAAHLSTLGFLLWLVRGDGVFPNPVEEFRRDPVRLLHPHSFCPEALGRLSWIASCDLRPPDYLADWTESRSYPYSLIATAERGGSGDTHAGEILTTQYQEEDFCLGTAEGEVWSQGQSDVFHLSWRRTRPALRIEDIRTAYTRYLINDEYPNDEYDSVPSHGNLHALQDCRTALVLARPSLDLAGKPLHRLKLSVLLPVYFGEIEDTAIRDGHVFVQDGTVRLAVRPLNASSWGGAESLKIERTGEYLLVSLFNYEGPERVFTREELGRTLNGFAFTVGLVDEESLEVFQSRILGAQCVDYWHFGFRTVRYRLGDSLLEMNYSVESDHVRFAAINGKILPRPIWEACGLPADRLPFLNGETAPNDVTLPYSHLRVAWSPEVPWMIASGGRPGSYGPGWRQADSLLEKTPAPV